MSHEIGGLSLFVSKEFVGIECFSLSYLVRKLVHSPSMLSSSFLIVDYGLIRYFVLFLFFLV